MNPAQPSPLIHRAFVLGAGLGTRLRPLTDQLPKPLLPLGGRPLITHIFDQLLPLGVREILINTHHASETYHLAFPDAHYQGVPLRFRHEPELLDTGGGIKNIQDLTDPNEPLLVYNGDIHSTLSLPKLLQHHHQSGNLVTLALRSSGHPRNVQLGDDGQILDLRSTFHITQGRPCLFSGIYVFQADFFAHLIQGKKESVIEAFLRLIQARKKLGGILLDEGCWSDIGTLEEYQRLQNECSGSPPT
ncbi:MAG: NTP transferase domain-containing protein [Blastochloris sp.]|nr:NTP transferase domain-containing protein [Blastochloris sp.]